MIFKSFKAENKKNTHYKHFNLTYITVVSGKLISWFKKEMENFIWAKMRIINQEQHLGTFGEPFCLLEVKAVIKVF